jgi:HEPN domain-containing protein
MKRISEEWLKAARDDLIVIEKIIDDEHLTHMVAFHSQQCIEKSLKAIIEEYEIGHVRIHNLERLFEIVKPHLSFDIDIAQIEKLDKLYVDARYPADLGLLPFGKPSPEDAEVFYETAQTVSARVTDHLERHSS